MMNNRRRQKSEFYHQEVQGARSRHRKPPNGSWQPTVPAWEKSFCHSVGSVSWRKLLEAKRVMYLYENVVQWNDSAGEEAFHNAKNRFWAKINGLPCSISLPDPDIYIDDVDWDSHVDPELLLDLEREPRDPDETAKGEEAVIIGTPLLLNQSFSCAGWGEAEENFLKAPDSALDPGYGDVNHNITNDENPWESNVAPPNGATKDNGSGNCWNDSCGWGDNCNGWGDNNGWNDVNGGTGGGEWETLDGSGWKREGAGWDMSRYRTSRFHGDEHKMDRGLWRQGRGRRRVNFVY